MNDEQQLRNLLGRYCELMDAADWEAVGALFADAELTADNGDVVAAGSDAVRDLYTRGTRLHDGSPRTTHVTANTVLEIDGERARARSTYVVFQSTELLPLQAIITGRYRDDFVRGDTGWRFARRQFSVHSVGDLSQHLTYAVPRS